MARAGRQIDPEVESARMNIALRSTDWVFSAVTAILVASIVVYALAMFLFIPRTSDIDELGLFNPVYMQLHYGHMTYPVYGHFHSMFVHPPVRYAEIAGLMRLGLPLPYAEGCMVCLLTIAIAFALAFARFADVSKLALLFGFFAGLLWMAHVYDRTYSLRPDTQLALAWFLGLVLLQDGYARGWSLPRLFLGSFAVTYASGLHYYGVVAFVGVSYYLVKARKELRSELFRRVAVSILGGGCLFGLPYLVFFVIPNRWDIVMFSHQVQAAGTWLSPVFKHFEQYSFWRLASKPASGIVPLYSLLYPFLYFKVPLFFVGSLLMMAKKDIRGIAIASLPLTVFVFVYSQGKSAGYFLPEVMIYFCGVATLAGLGVKFLAERAAPKLAQAVVPIFFLGGSCWAMQLGYPEYAHARVSRQALIPAMDIARACAKQLVGKDALIGGRIGLWYISGAQRWYDISADLLWKKDISVINLREYFSRFDYIVEHDHMSNTTVNSSLQSLPSWYVSGLLKLRGFFVADLHPNMNFLIFSAHQQQQVAGYIVEKGKVYRFGQRLNGNAVFISRVCKFESWPAINRFDLPLFNAIYLPKGGLRDSFQSILPQARPGDAQSAVVTSVLSAKEFALVRNRIDAECASLDTVYGDLEEVSVDKLMEEWRTTEQPMLFYQSIDDFVASRFQTNEVLVPSFDVDHLQLAYKKAGIRGRQSKIVTTASEPYSFAAAIDIPSTRLGERGWVSVRQQVRSGQIGIGILDRKKNDFVNRRFVDREDTFQTIYLPVNTATGPSTLIIENGNSGGSGEIEIQKLAIVAEPPH
jgi:hypothetical protein